jgi:hypothetical protein
VEVIWKEDHENLKEKETHRPLDICRNVRWMFDSELEKRAD